MKLTQTQRDKIYKLILDWMFINLYEIQDVKHNDNYCLTDLKREPVLTRTRFLKLKHLWDNKRILKNIKTDLLFIELIDMPSKTLREYYLKVKPQYINYLENPLENPLEAIQIGFYI